MMNADNCRDDLPPRLIHSCVRIISLQYLEINVIIMQTLSAGLSVCIFTNMPIGSTGTNNNVMFIQS